MILYWLIDYLIFLMFYAVAATLFRPYMEISFVTVMYETFV